MRKPKNLGRQALNKRSDRPRLKACDVQNLGHNCPHVVEFPILSPARAAVFAQVDCPHVGSFARGLGMTPPIYIITLASATQRRAFQQAQAERLGFEPIWHPAVGVDDMSDAFFLQHAFSWQRPLKKTEVGCFMSHYQLWQRIAQSDGPAVVLEDDVMLGGDWLADIRTLADQASADFICLETWGKKLLGETQTVSGLLLKRLALNSAGAAGYVLWPTGARRLLDRFESEGAALTDAFINQTEHWQAWQLVPANVVQMNIAPQFGLKSGFESPSLIARESVQSPTPPSPKSWRAMRLKRLRAELKKARVRLFGALKSQRQCVPFMSHPRL
jgi:glycosyl transferase family 25